MNKKNFQFLQENVVNTEIYLMQLEELLKGLTQTR